jgi:hypothetical protein
VGLWEGIKGLGGVGMRNRPRSTPETALKRAAKDFLRIHGVWSFHVLQGMGAYPGIADRIGIFKGKPLAIEFKAGRGVLSDAQRQFKAEWEREGGLYIEARSIEDLAAGLGIKTLMGV